MSGELEPLGRSHATPPEISEEISELRAVLSPTETLRVLDDFAKWLFPSAAVAGSLGAAFGVSGLNGLEGTGRTLFAVAVLSLGVSLALAAASRTPRIVHVVRTSRESMRDALTDVVKLRWFALAGSSAFFAVALILASLAPLFSK